MKKNKNLLAEQGVMDDVSIAKLSAALLGIEYPGDEYFVSDTPKIKSKKEMKRELKAQKRQSKKIKRDAKYFERDSKNMMRMAPPWAIARAKMKVNITMLTT